MQSDQKLMTKGNQVMNYKGICFQVNNKDPFGKSVKKIIIILSLFILHRGCVYDIVIVDTKIRNKIVENKFIIAISKARHKCSFKAHYIQIVPFSLRPNNRGHTQTNCRNKT